MSKISTKDYIKSHKNRFVVGIVTSLIPVLVFFATWQFHFKIIFESSALLFVFLAIFACVPFILFLADIIFVKNTKLNMAAFVVGLMYTVAFFFLLAYAMSKLFYVVYETIPYFAVFSFAAVILLMIFFPKFKRGKTIRVILAVALSAIFIFVTAFEIFDLKPLYFNSGAVVFAVEDEYQIAFSTSKNTVGNIKVGDSIFYDSIGGSKNVSTIHKISVPRALLDEEKSYTVECTSVIRNRAYFASSGGSVKKCYDFRPADESDGLRIFNFSDNHLIRSGVERTVSHLKDLDIIVANGDLFNDVSDEFQVTLVYKLLGNISGSSLPIIITRGNHEAIGSKLTSLPNYIGSYDGNFYYTVRFDSVLFYIFDLANDMSDSNVSIRSTANFDEYRLREIEWIKTLNGAAQNQLDGIKHAIALCHMPYPITYEKPYTKYARMMTDAAEHLGIDLLLSGHKHRTEIYEVGNYENAADHPYILGGKRSNTLEVDETIFADQFTGTYLVINDDGISASFINSKGKILQRFDNI